MGYDKTKWSTGNEAWPDAEDYIMETQCSWTEGAADSQDWASPGHQ